MEFASGHQNPFLDGTCPAVQKRESYLISVATCCLIVDVEPECCRTVESLDCLIVELSNCRIGVHIIASTVRRFKTIRHSGSVMVRRPVDIYRRSQTQPPTWQSPHHTWP